MHRHRRWLRSAVAEIKARREAGAAAERRRARLAEASAALRKAILAGEGVPAGGAKRGRGGGGAAENAAVVPASPEQQQPEAAEAISVAEATIRPPPPPTMVADLEAFVDAAIASGDEPAEATSKAAEPEEAEAEAAGGAEAAEQKGAVDAPGAAMAGEQGRAAAEVTQKKRAKAAARLPAWARTAEDAEAVEEAEVDDLLAFADNLDFDSYDDMNEEQLRGAIADMERRAKEEEEAAEREQAEAQAATAMAGGTGAPPPEVGGEAEAVARETLREAKSAAWRREFAGLMNALVSKEQGRAKADAIEQGTAPAPADDVASVASHLLATRKDLKAIHSAASLQKVVEQVELESQLGDA